MIRCNESLINDVKNVLRHSWLRGDRVDLSGPRVALGALVNCSVDYGLAAHRWPNGSAGRMASIPVGIARVHRVSRYGCHRAATVRFIGKVL